MTHVWRIHSVSSFFVIDCRPSYVHGYADDHKKRGHEQCGDGADDALDEGGGRSADHGPVHIHCCPAMKTSSSGVNVSSGGNDRNVLTVDMNCEYGT
jgi:hypothetical protein